MYFLKTTDLQPGMILDENVFSIDDNLIAPKGTVLSSHLINQLEVYGIFIVDVKSIYPEDDWQMVTNEDD